MPRTAFPLILVLANVLPCDAIDFAHQIVPILKRHCVECHGGDEAKGGFSLNDRELFLESGAVDPGNWVDSQFLKLVSSTDPNLRMPPQGLPRVSAADQALLSKWANEQLPWTEGFTFAVKKYAAPLLPRDVTLPGPEGMHPIDQWLGVYRRANQIQKPEPVSDAVFIRRASMDLLGLLPTKEQLDQFTHDTATNKRQRLVQEFLSDDIAYAEHWITFWNDLLRNDYAGTGFITGGRKQISEWLYRSLIDNKPYDQFARELIAPPNESSRGFIDGIKWRGTVSAGQTIEIQFAQSVAQSFLGINLKCASCHDSFIDQWKLSDAYSLAAIYAKDSLSIHRCDKPTGEIASAGWLYPELGQIDQNAPPAQRLKQLSVLMTEPRNGRFARTIANRLWAQLMGRGIVHPLDAMHGKPWDEDLLDYLANELVASNYDLKAMLRLIATSEAYQSRSEIVDEANANAEGYRFLGRRAHRMTAEQYLDAVWQITGSAPTDFDAPIVRGKVDRAAMDKIVLKGEWIWGQERRPDSVAHAPEEKQSQPPGDKKQDKVEIEKPEISQDSLPSGLAAANEQLVFRHAFYLPAAVASGTAVITADNAFELYINRRKVAASDDWTKVQIIPLTNRFQVRKKGDDNKNVIVIVARNLGNKPNPAGVYFEARMTLKDGSELAFQSDGSWTYSDQPPKGSREGRLGQTPGPWKPVVAQGRPQIYSQVNEQLVRGLAMSDLKERSMIRAGLLKSDFLMRSLGRPNRDQIVSSRPDELTTLEAIDLANGEMLATALHQGAEHLASLEIPPAQLADRIFLEALSRSPTHQELEIVEASFNRQDDRGDTDFQVAEDRIEAIEDLLWAIFMMPEFIMVR